MQMFLVYITCKDKKEARKIAKKLLSERLIGCANIVQKIESIYWWRGKLVQVQESLLLCKTTKEKIPEIKKMVKRVHSYSVPCIEFIKIADQNKEYFEWLKRVLVYSKWQK
ncbi:MAG: divalent-cation tolerance protein CutA [Candidatus Diapherotrites archaeon]|nr:divalent-cation tolerance protein CutA [Candidatus Diapherotrites archaeon]